jgi:hypothetical protein
MTKNEIFKLAKETMDEDEVLFVNKDGSYSQIKVKHSDFYPDSIARCTVVDTKEKGLEYNISVWNRCIISKPGEGNVIYYKEKKKAKTELECEFGGDGYEVSKAFPWSTSEVDTDA